MKFIDQITLSRYYYEIIFLNYSKNMTLKHYIRCSIQKIIKNHNPFSKYYYIRLQTKENKYPKDSFIHHLYLLTNTEELDQYMKKIIKDISSDNPTNIKNIRNELKHIDDKWFKMYVKM